jgi:hypothetical protein
MAQTIEGLLQEKTILVENKVSFVAFFFLRWKYRPYDLVENFNPSSLSFKANEL